MKKIIRNIIGILILLFGMVGSLIPILQGWVFVLIGFMIIDFKKKKEYEKTFLNFISKSKLGFRLVKLWEKVKRVNKDVIQKDKDKKISKIYHDIKKDLDM